MSKTITLSTDELKDLVRNTVKETLVELLTEKKDLLEAIEEHEFIKAIEEGDKGEYVDESVILDKLRTRK